MIDETTGEITGYKTTIGGADTVFPFKSDNSIAIKLGSGAGTYDITQFYDDWQSLTNSNFAYTVGSIGASSANGGSNWPPGGSIRGNIGLSYNSSSGLLTVSNVSETVTIQGEGSYNRLSLSCGVGNVWLVVE